MVQVILYAWVFGVEKGFQFANEDADLRLPRLFKFVIRYISPTFLLVVFVMWCWKNLPERIAGMRQEGMEGAVLALGMIGAVLICFLLLVMIAGRRWKAESRDTSPRNKWSAKQARSSSCFFSSSIIRTTGRRRTDSEPKVPTFDAKPVLWERHCAPKIIETNINSVKN
jgi:hypothetical protein